MIVTPEEARLADALRYLRAFPGATKAQEGADRLLAFYTVEACNRALLPRNHPETKGIGVNENGISG